MPPSLREMAERSEDGGSVVRMIENSPSHSLRCASPLCEGARVIGNTGTRHRFSFGKSGIAFSGICTYNNKVEIWQMRFIYGEYNGSQLAGE